MFQLYSACIYNVVCKPGMSWSISKDGNNALVRLRLRELFCGNARDAWSGIRIRHAGELAFSMLGGTPCFHYSCLSILIRT